VLRTANYPASLAGCFPIFLGADASLWNPPGIYCAWYLAPPVLPGVRFGNRLVRHAKMPGEAGKRQARLMKVAGLWRNTLIEGGWTSILPHGVAEPLACHSPRGLKRGRKTFVWLLKIWNNAWLHPERRRPA
jgi:hypothetical protein